MSDSARTGRGQRLVPIVLFGLVTAVAMWAATPAPVGAFVDDGFYTVLAQSLATGQGYRYLNVPGAPNATHFPPGYPALLALLWRVWPVFPDNVALFRLANVLLTAAASVGAYAFARRRLGLGTGAAVVAAAAGALSVPSLLLTGMLLSEPLFLALLFPTLRLAERAADAEVGDTGAARLRLAAAAGVLCGALVLVRSIAGVLAAAAVMVLLVRRRPGPAAALAAACGAVVVPWHLWVAAHDAAVPDALGSMYTSYSGWLASAVRGGGAAFVTDVVGRNIARVGQLLGDAFAPGAGGALGALAALVVCALVAAALWRAAAGAAPVTALFVTLYLGVVALWPFDPSRFVWGLWPLFTLLLVAGVGTVAVWRPAARPAAILRGGALAASVAVAAGAATYYARGYRGRWWGSVPRMAEGTLVPLLRWVAARTAPDDVLVTPGETTVYLYTRRRCLPAEPFTSGDYLRPRTEAEEAALLRRMLERFRVRYVIVATAGGLRAVNGVLAKDPGSLSVVEQLPGGATVLAPARP